MNKYTGFPFEFKITEASGNVWILDTTHQFADVDPRTDKVQQFTGAVDRNGAKVYFGDTLRFADKHVYYVKEYWPKVHVYSEMTTEQAIAEIETLPYYECVVEAGLDLEYLQNDDMRLYFEVVNEPKP